MEKEKEGFPITSLREINTILKAQHPNIVTVRVRPPGPVPKGSLGVALTCVVQKRSLRGPATSAP